MVVQQELVQGGPVTCPVIILLDLTNAIKVWITK